MRVRNWLQICQNGSDLGLFVVSLWRAHNVIFYNVGHFIDPDSHRLPLTAGSQGIPGDPETAILNHDPFDLIEAHLVAPAAITSAGTAGELMGTSWFIYSRKNRSIASSTRFRLGSGRSRFAWSLTPMSRAR
jgi:hypothetical protein